MLIEAGCKVTAVDFSETACELTRRLVPAATVIKRDLRVSTGLPVTADAAVLIQVLEHLGDDFGALYLALDAAPVVIVSVPRSGKIRSPSHVREYTPDQIRNRFGKLGCLKFHKAPPKLLIFSILRRGWTPDGRPLTLVTGHPRSGTGYMAALMRAHGFNVGHEKVERDGISSWQWAVDSDVVPDGDPRCSRDTETTILVVRNPLQVIASSAFTLRPRSWAFMAKYIGPLPSKATPVKRAMVTWCRWNDLCLNLSPDLVTNVEDAPRNVARFLGSNAMALPRTTINSRPHRNLTVAKIKKHATEFDRVVEMAEHLGLGRPKDWA